VSKSTRSIAREQFRRSFAALAAIAVGLALVCVSGTGSVRLPVAEAQSQVVFSKTFTPDTIGPGATTTLVFTIQNLVSSPVSELAFTDALPAAVSIAVPANPTSTCGGTLTATDGGGTISLVDGQVGAYGTCIITVDVTSSTAGTHRNVTGVLAWSDGENGNAIDDLYVVTNRPGFSKSFAPSSVSYGGRSTLTFTIDNTANNASASNLTFADTFPAGMVVADPANASTTCTGGTVIAIPGTSTVSFSGGTVLNGAACTVSVDVVATAVGALGNVSAELTSLVSGTTRSSGKASAVLEVTASEIALIKSFTDDPAAPGSTVTLEFTILNLDRSETLTNIAFTDDLDATLAGLVATGLPASNVCGTGSQLSGDTTLALTGGSLAPEGSCTFSITLQVPVTATTGAYTNTTSLITADGGLRGDPGSDVLYVSPAPLLTKEFTSDPVAAGDTVTLTFTVSNTSPVMGATSIAFIDDLTAFLPYPVSVGMPAGGFCGPGATMSLISLGTEEQGLSMTGGSLDEGGSCTFSVTINVPVGMPGGTYINITEQPTAEVGGETATGQPAIDQLVVIAAPKLSKSFTDDPVSPGDTVTLEFELALGGEAPGDATEIAFTDNLVGVVPGLTAIGLPANDVCGEGSQLAGTTNLSFTGGSLSPGESCVFSVTLQVPADAPYGTLGNQTSSVTADMLGLTGVATPATDSLTISDIFFAKTFVGDPVIPGDTVTLSFTISNTHPVSVASAIVFTDSLDAVLPGLVATGLPATDICGPGSQIAGTGSLSFTGGNVGPGDSCTFEVTLQVPGGASTGTYGNVTSDLTANYGTTAVMADPAVDMLEVRSDWLLFSKTFTDDPVLPGDMVTLEFEITNDHPTGSATGIGFTDNLTATLSGLTAIGLPASDVCGAGSQLSGTDLLTFSGGSLGPGASCTFTVTLQVPDTVTPGIYVNTTGQAAGSIDGLQVIGDPAWDELTITEPPQDEDRTRRVFLPLVLQNYNPD